MGEHILSWMTFFPVIGAAVIAFIEKATKGYFALFLLLETGMSACSARSTSSSSTCSGKSCCCRCTS
jgi:hypothetical protein